MTAAGLASSLPEAYRLGQLRGFHRLAPGDLGAALEAEHPAPREPLARALGAYLGRIGAHPAALENAARLAAPNSRAVVTGQQAGLLGGPAYTVYKAATAVLLARAHDREDRPVVPVFWVASQDHDAAEVGSAHLLDFEETEHHLRLPLPEGRAVGRIRLEPAWVEGTLAALRAFVAPEEHKAAVIALVEAAASGAASYADWFARIVSGLLGQHGLVVLDPLDPGLAALFEGPLRRELAGPLVGPRAIEEAARRLEALGFEPQLRRPAGATNLFLEEGDGRRRLLRFDGRAFQAEAAYSRADLEAIARLEPGRLTPAAGLRPAFQDAVLPTAAAVLGPGELAYQLQLLGVYGHLGVPQPVLWPRLSVTWLETPVRRILARYGLSAQVYAADPDGALRDVLMERAGAAEAFRAGLADLERAFEGLGHRLDRLDPTLEGAVERSRARVLGHVSRLERKVGGALARGEEGAERGLGRLRAHLRPGGLPQERRLGFLTYAMKYGPEPLRRLLELEPTGTHFLDL